MDFHDPDMLALLEGARDADLDALPFGVIAVRRTDGTVARYNVWEARFANLDRSWVLGRDFFNEVGLCMNNVMVAQRFRDLGDLDETLDYVLTFRMKPKRVRLRLLQGADSPLSWILVTRI